MTHPEDWHHQNIAPGKGQPPEAYFMRQKGKGKQKGKVEVDGKRKGKATGRSQMNGKGRKGKGEASQEV